MPKKITRIKTIKNIRYRVKSSNGVYETLHPETNSNQVIMNNGSSLQEDINNVKNAIKNIKASSIICNNGENVEDVLNRILNNLKNTLILRE